MMGEAATPSYVAYTVWSFIALTPMFTFVPSCDAVCATECISYAAVMNVTVGTHTYRHTCGVDTSL